MARAPQVSLTPREMDVLQLMATAATYREIGEQLHIGEETVRSHAKSILAKLDQPNRTQAVIAAVRADLISLD
jgi:DNA-binding CsgD family transcriptional regulator